MIGFFINTIANKTFVRLDNEELTFAGQLEDNEFSLAVKNKWAIPNGSFVNFSEDGEKKFFKYIKDKMKHGTVRNIRRKSITEG